MSSGEKEESYSGDSFYDDEPSSSKREQDEGESHHYASAASPSFQVEDKMSRSDSSSSFSSAKEDPAEVSSSPAPEAAVVRCMSTIEEESKSYETNTAASVSISRRVVEQAQTVENDREDEVQNAQLLEQNLNRELEDFRQVIKETENSEVSCTTSSLIDDSSRVVNVQDYAPFLQQIHNPATGPKDDFDAILDRVQRMESSTDVLEKLVSLDPNTSDLDAFLSQIPTSLLDSMVDAYGEDISRQSSSEIASLHKLIEGSGDRSFSLNSEVAGGNKLLGLSEAPDTKSERAVDDVLREYVELERSVSQASLVDESFRSDISSLPQLSTYSNNVEVQRSIPVIKPPVLKTYVTPPVTTSSSGINTPRHCTTLLQPLTLPMSKEINCPTSTNASKPTGQQHDPNEGGLVLGTNQVSYDVDVVRKQTEMKSGVSQNSSRAEGSQSSSGIKLKAHQGIPQTARPTSSATTALSGTRDYDQNSFKPRNKKSMRSPRTVASPRQTGPESFRDIPTNSSRGGAGEGYHIRHGLSNSNDKTEYAVTEALKTIEKLNGIVVQQESMMAAFSENNKSLWCQLKDSKVQSEEQEKKFQERIDFLQSQVASLTINRLVESSTNANTNSPRQVAANKAELQRVREDSEVKSQQLMELRKEILILQSKLTEQSRQSSSKPKQFYAAATTLPHEKEKDYQKTINALSKQVRTLQKILYSKDATAPTQQQNPTALATTGSRSNQLQRTKSDVMKSNASSANQRHQQAMINSVRNIGVDGSGIFSKRPGSFPGNSKSININTGNILNASLSCMEQEREEFENIIGEKNRLIFDKERVILGLKEEVETLKSQLPEGDTTDHGLIDELRSRIITQNKVIQTLKEHLSSYKKLETENLLLQEEKSSLEQQVVELKRKLGFAQNLGKPENEVLSLLSEKVDELNSRYYHREKQLDTLLNRLTLKTTSVGSSNLSPRRLPLDQITNNNVSHGGPLVKGFSTSTALVSTDILNMADLSPSTSFQLFGTVSDPDM